MIYTFSSLKGVLKIDAVTIDNGVFFMHYKLTFLALAAFSLFTTSAQYIGDPIDCIVEGVPSTIMDTYCWIHSTFTLPRSVTGRVGKDVVQPGVASYVEGEHEIRYHKYYQWVCFVLCFQAMCFYAPRFLWKAWEGQRLKSLVLDLNNPVIDEESKAQQIKQVVNYFAVNMHCQNFYAIRFFFCEFLNFVNVIGQIWFMNYFMEGEFISYGLDVMRFSNMIDADPDSRTDPMERVFPKITKCTFHRFGPSGSLQKLDGMCVLSVNNVNEKIYVFLWFWFLLVALISTLNMIYRAAVIMFPLARSVLLKFRSRFAPQDKINVIMRTFQLGDWFVFYQLGKNIEATTYKILINEMVKHLDGLNV